MRKFAKSIVIVLISLLTCYAFLNFCTGFITALRDRSIANQIRYIDNALRSGKDSLLQTRYPEGMVFGNALFALSVIDRMNADPDNRKTYARMVDRCIGRLLSDQAKSTFPKDGELKYGAFYNGWLNFLLAEYITSPGFSYSDIQEISSKTYAQISSDIAALQRDSLRIVYTYQYGSWPADNLVCMASLAPEYGQVRQNWLSLIRSTSTHPDALLFHEQSDPATARGSSQAMMIYFLSFFDPDAAILENEIFQKRFVRNIGALQLVREYETSGSPDIDSGPIVFGYGAAATVMNIKTQSALGKSQKGTWGLLNMAGMPLNLFGQKYYLFKQEILFDIFMLWGSVSL